MKTENLTIEELDQQINELKELNVPENEKEANENKIYSLKYEKATLQIDAKIEIISKDENFKKGELATINTVRESFNEKLKANPNPNYKKLFERASNLLAMVNLPEYNSITEVLEEPTKDEFTESIKTLDKAIDNNPNNEYLKLIRKQLEEF